MVLYFLFKKMNYWAAKINHSYVHKNEKWCEAKCYRKYICTKTEMGNQQKIITGTCILIKLRCRSTMLFGIGVTQQLLCIGLLNKQLRI